MNASKDDGERSVRDWLRTRIDGPPPEPEQPPLVQVHIIPTPADEDDADDQEQPEEPADPEPEQKPAWWQVRPRDLFGGPTEPDEPPQDTVATAPGIHVTVNQPIQAPPWTVPDPVAERAAERLHRRQVWLAYHGAAAGTGWVFGLVEGMAEMIASAAHAAAPVGIAIGLVSWIVASYLPGLPYVPPALRPVIVWAARIPVCSAALALALHAPGTL
ncbi:hypothetical protein OG292_19255 [Streptomyces sp. NBC_01511]|uniref:hypothetical protein n=1 Tax=Streptomyces sp. NBC_01511 TaxID=2903889 RepID=UPI003862FBF7